MRRLARNLSVPLTCTILGGCVVSTPGPPGTPPEIPLPPERETESAPQQEEDGPVEIGAKHILISYKGAMRAAPYVQRTKEEARQLAEELHQQAASGADFGKLAEEHSDDPGSAADGGSLGTFRKNQMVGAFSDAAFALPVGGLSKVVETPFGFHIIQRTE